MGKYSRLNAKSMKVVPLKGFVIYSTYLLIIHLMIMCVAIAYNIFFNGAQGKLHGVPEWYARVVYACAYAIMSLMCYVWSFSCCCMQIAITHDTVYVEIFE